MTIKLTAKQQTRRAAQIKKQAYLEALDEHLSEAERNDNPLMADLYRTFYHAILKSEHVRPDGSLNITLDLTGGR